MSVQAGLCFDISAERVILQCLCRQGYVVTSVDINADRVMLQCLCRQGYAVMSVDIITGRCVA